MLVLKNFSLQWSIHNYLVRKCVVCNLLPILCATCVLDLSKRVAVKVEDFAEHVASIKAQNGAKIIEEFESLVIDAPFTQHAAKLLRNKTKNRYKNVIPCEFSAVLLSKQAVIASFR